MTDTTDTLDEPGTSPANGRHEPGISLQEAALRLDLSERTIRRMLQEGELQGYKQKATRGYVWRVVLDSPAQSEPSVEARQAGNEPGVSPAEGRQEVGTSPAAPDLMKALEIIETIRREHEDARRELEAKADRLQQEASEKGEKIAELTGAAAHWQTRALLAEEQARKAEEQVKLLMAPKDESAEETPAEQAPRRSWWRRLIGG